MWHTGDGEAFFQTFADDRLVLDGGRCTHR
jgi:hypothetical protein